MNLALLQMTKKKKRRRRKKAKMMTQTKMRNHLKRNHPRRKAVNLSLKALTRKRSKNNKRHHLLSHRNNNSNILLLNRSSKTKNKKRCSWFQLGLDLAKILIRERKKNSTAS